MPIAIELISLWQDLRALIKIILEPKSEWRKFLATVSYWYLEWDLVFHKESSVIEVELEPFFNGIFIKKNERNTGNTKCTHKLPIAF